MANINVIMKKTFLAICASLTMAYSYGQNTSPWPATGSVGIGTTSPAYSLDVVGIIRASSKVITPLVNNQYIGSGANGATNSFAVGTAVLGNPGDTGYGNVAIGVNILNNNTTGFANTSVGLSTLAFNTTGINNMAFGGSALLHNTTGNDNIGIGYQALMSSTTTYGSLAIGTNSLALANGQGNTGVGYQTGSDITNGTGNTFLGFFTGSKITGSNNTVIGSSMSTEPSGIITGSGNTILGGNIRGLSPTLTNHIILADGSGNIRLIADNTGNIGIGTGSPDMKLTVAGTIHSTEVKVDTSIPTPDYVFDSGYELTSLNEVKKYIDKNHHLPEIPSAAQVAKEGINLGEMNTRLLKKVEELTLYLIESNKELKTQKAMIMRQQKQINKIVKGK